jgi:hypothetical protein
LIFRNQQRHNKKKNLPEVSLGGRLGLECAVDLVETAEGGLSPDAEAANVTTRRDLQQVESRDVQQGDTFEKEILKISIYLQICCI